MTSRPLPGHSDGKEAVTAVADVAATSPMNPQMRSQRTAADRARRTEPTLLARCSRQRDHLAPGERPESPVRATETHRLERTTRVVPPRSVTLAVEHCHRPRARPADRSLRLLHRLRGRAAVRAGGKGQPPAVISRWGPGATHKQTAQALEGGFAGRALHIVCIARGPRAG